MSPLVETSTPPNTPAPIFIVTAKIGMCITIGGTAEVSPAMNQLVGDNVASHR